VGDWTLRLSAPLIGLPGFILTTAKTSITAMDLRTHPTGPVILVLCIAGVSVVRLLFHVNMSFTPEASLSWELRRSHVLLLAILRSNLSPLSSPAGEVSRAPSQSPLRYSHFIPRGKGRPAPSSIQAT
jgi:hypothetical protein